MKGLHIHIVAQTKKTSWTYNGSKIHYLSPIDFCILIENCFTQIELLYIRISNKHLDVFRAYDIALSIRKCADNNVSVFAFIDYLTFPNLVAISFAKERVCPPLEGPAFLSFNFKKIEAQVNTEFLSIYKSNNKDGILFTDEKNDTESNLREQNVSQKIDDILLSILRQGTGVQILRPYYHSSTQAALDGLLTRTMYLDQFNMLDIGNNVTWKKKSILKFAINKTNRLFRIMSLTQSFIGIYLFDCNTLTHNYESAKLFNLLKRAKSLRFIAIIIVLKHKGGQLKIADELHCLIKKTNEFLPIFFYVYIGTSSGLLIASSGIKMVLQPTSIIGSVGTISVQIKWDKIGEVFQIKLPSSYSSEAIVENNQLGYSLLKKRLADQAILGKNSYKKVINGHLIVSEEVELGPNSLRVQSLSDLIEIVKKNNSINGKIPKLVSIDLERRFSKIFSFIVNTLNYYFG